MSANWAGRPGLLQRERAKQAYNASGDPRMRHGGDPKALGRSTVPKAEWAPDPVGPLARKPPIRVKTTIQHLIAGEVDEREQQHASPRFPTCEARGSYFEIGCQVGEALREELLAFVQATLSEGERVGGADVWVAGAGRVPERGEALRQSVDVALELARAFAPHLLEELEGMAETSGLSMGELMACQVRAQLGGGSLNPQRASSTALGVGSGSSATGGPIVAQSFDAGAEFDAHIAVITRRPTGGVATITVGPVGLLGSLGLAGDAHVGGRRTMGSGLGLCVSHLDGACADGLPHSFVCRLMLEAGGLREAQAALEHATRSMPANFLVGSAEETLSLEAEAGSCSRGVRVLRTEAPAVERPLVERQGGVDQTRSDRVVHTNHRVGDARAEADRRQRDRREQYEAGAWPSQSAERLRRATALLSEAGPAGDFNADMGATGAGLGSAAVDTSLARTNAARSKITIGGLQAVLGDHDGAFCC